MTAKKAAPAAAPVDVAPAPAAASEAAPAAKTKKASKADVVDFIVKNPTASDQRVAAELEGETDVDFVQAVRDGMGPRHSWPEPKKTKED